ncbi:MAG: hypothetical protein AAF228_04410 [Pseudomonadota bacterium]
MTYWNDLGLAPQDQLLEARLNIHKAMQWVTLAARANIEPWPDDGHSNLGWSHEHQMFTSHAFPQQNGKDLGIGLSPAKLELSIWRDKIIEERLSLHGKSHDEVGKWLDGQLLSAGYKIASDIKLSYALGENLLAISTYTTESIEQGLLEYEKWFAVSDELLQEIAQDPELTAFKPGPSQVRTWPHHIDTATYIQLEDGDFEKARGIGVGMAAGDKNCPDPYFYCYPWPRPNPETLPDLKSAGCYWSKTGYVGTLMPRSQVLDCTDRKASVNEFLREVIKISRDVLKV